MTMKNLRLLRESGNLSQQKLADQVGVSQAQIYSYENNVYEPAIDTLKRFAEFFETSVDYIIDNTDIKHKIEHIEKFDLNAEEALLIEKYRTLPPNARNSIFVMIDTLLDGK